MVDKLSIKIGFKIRQLRIKKELSQSDLAEKIGVTKSYISRVETGKGGFSINTLKKFATALEVEMDYFYDLKTDSEKQEAINKIKDQIAEYGASDDVRVINQYLKEYPEVQKKILEYLESYHAGGKSRLSRLGGFIDAVAPEEIEAAISLLIQKLKKC